MTEIWKIIEPFGGIYLVSNQGRVKSMKRKWVTWDKNLIPSPRKDGYLFVTLNKKTHSVHRLVAKAFVSNPDGKEEVNHKNSNRSDNRAENLEWVTPKENMRHAILQGNIHGLKINQTIANEIRNKYMVGKLTQQELSELYLVGQDNISRIVNNKIWRTS
jgi:hypothetical protein